MAHITAIETMATHLNDAGATMDPIQVMTKVVCTLPPTFENFLSVWDNVPANEKIMQLLTSRLLREESVKKRWSSEDTVDTVDTEKAFARNQPTSSRTSNPTSKGAPRRGR